MVSERAPFGRPRSAELPENGMVRLRISVPAQVARLLYGQASAERRYLTSIVTEALDEHFVEHPPESWSAID